MTGDAGTAWRSLREIDQAAGRAKGSAFRAFRAIAGELREGEDFRILRAGQSAAQRDEVRQLLEQGRIYAGSISVILLSSTAAARVQALAEAAR